ncbi:putative membrane protein YccC [Sphingomonas sp. PP-CE-3A-406]|uniref:FUSC family protein n=1 Tax=Sphingomonas sp. PP-CE-3A-406 TaxID=2135659 RepID=UPI000EF9EF69|nr:FUSC family protein [Sphingomonas sp. PP-CE-3A-406]RMB54534.1 putative membrane protein YccC [Sphingomonas sp. PP-CE-3A-406]
MMLSRFGSTEALFTVKCFVAAMLAYYIALRIGLTRPYWAVTTSYIVAQPLAGAVLSKAVFRVAGTVLGAVAAVVLVPNLVNAPELLSLGLALWLGLCLYISLLDRTPRAYLFLLAGYTASIIGFPSVEAPGAVFTTAALRVQEITIGILCGSLIHGFVFPQTVTAVLLGRIDAILGDAERWSRDSLAGESDAALSRDRRRLALDINELHQLSIHLPFDTARLLPRVRTLRALQAELSMLLPLASAVDDRIVELRRGADAPRPEAIALIEDVRDWLRDPLPLAERGETADALIARARALEPPVGDTLIWRDALRLSLLARLAELIDAHRNARDLRDQMRSPSRTPVTPAVTRLLARTTKRPLHRDRGIALRAALGTIATILLGCIFWIGTGWADGAGAVLIAGVCCALFGNSDDPAPSIMAFFYGTIIGLVISAVYAFAILPRVTDFVTLMAVLAPPMLIGGMYLARPATLLVTLGALLGGLNTVGLNDRFGSDFSAFINGGIAQLVGTLFAVVTVGLFQTIGADTSARRLIRAGWRELATRSDSPGRPDAAGWIARMLDRIGLLAPRLAAQGEDPGKPLLDALTDLRVGVAVGELKQLRLDGTPGEAAAITPVLRGVGRHYRALRPDRPAPPEPDLLAGIDTAMAGFATSTPAGMSDRRRTGVLALTSLRRNLFPQAPAYGATP